MPTLKGPGRPLAFLVCCLAAWAVLVSGCAMPGDAAPVVKIGLVAPFEGLGRPLGYSVLPAVKLAIADANASGELGRYRAALVALNDDNDPATAAAQGQALAEDPDVVAALGPWGTEPARAAAHVYSRQGIPGLIVAPMAAPPAGVRTLCPDPAELAPVIAGRAAGSKAGPLAVAGPSNELARALAPADGAGAAAAAQENTPRAYTGDAEAAADDLVVWRRQGWRGTLFGGPDLARPWFIGRAGKASEGVQAAACALDGELAADFAARYQTQTGSQPDADAALAYSGARLLLHALARDIRANGRPSRAGTAAALAGQEIKPQVQWLQVRDGRWIQ